MFGKIMSDETLCTELLDRGQAYDELSKSYVVFICPFDIFHMGRHIYEFRNYCNQDRTLELGDEATKIFLNAKGTQGDITPQLKEFLDYVAGKETDTPSEFIIRLKGALSDAKLNKRWRRERMILYLRDQDIRAAALKEGRELGHAEGHAKGHAGVACPFFIMLPLPTLTFCKGFSRDFLTFSWW